MTKRQLKTAVRLMRDAERRIRPDAAWVGRARESLLKTVQREAAAQPAPSFAARSRALILAYVPRRTVDLIRGPVMAALSVFGIIAGGSLASVSAAERSIPGDLLYPVKIATEQARIFMEKEPPDQLKLKTEFVERRGDEIRQIAKDDTPKRAARLREATDMLKKDLDAVKSQLHAVASGSPAPKVVAAAKDVDESSGRLAQALKEVKDSLPEDVKPSVAEVQVAAVTTGVKAVQVLIDTHNDPDAQDLVSAEDLKRVVNEHVQGLEAGIADTAKKVADATRAPLSGASSTTVLGLDLPTSTDALATSTAPAVDLLKEPLDQLKAAQASLEETRQLLNSDRFDAVKDKLGEATKAAASAEKTVTSVLPSLLAPTGTTPLPAETPVAAPTSSLPTTSTVSGTAASTTGSVATTTVVK